MCVWHDSYVCATYLVHMRSFIHVFQLCDMNYIHACVTFVWHDLHSYMCFICVTCLTFSGRTFLHVFHMCNMSHICTCVPFVRHISRSLHDFQIWQANMYFAHILIYLHLREEFFMNPLVYIPMMMGLKWCPKNARIQTVSQEFEFSNGRHPENAEIQMVGVPMMWGFKRRHRQSHPFTSEHTTFNGIWQWFNLTLEHTPKCFLQVLFAHTKVLFTCESAFCICFLQAFVCKLCWSKWFIIPNT